MIAMSIGYSRKVGRNTVQFFDTYTEDRHIKWSNESGPLLEFFDREVNVVKAFLKTVLGQEYHADIDALEVENEITLFTINDDKRHLRNIALMKTMIERIYRKAAEEAARIGVSIRKELPEGRFSALANFRKRRGWWRRC